MAFNQYRTQRVCVSLLLCFKVDCIVLVDSNVSKLWISSHRCHSFKCYIFMHVQQ